MVLASLLVLSALGAAQGAAAGSVPEVRRAEVAAEPAELTGRLAAAPRPPGAPGATPRPPEAPAGLGTLPTSPAAAALGLALDIAEVAGATHRDVSLVVGPSVGADEAAALRRELTRASLFRVVGDAGASARVELSREGELVIARVTTPRGRLLGEARERWPRPPSPGGATARATAAYGGSGPAGRAALERINEFELRRLYLADGRPGLPTAPAALGFRTGEPEPTLAPFAGWGWTEGFAVPPPPQTHEAWSVLRGDGRVLTDMELARASNRPDLAESLGQDQADHRLLWGASFGTLAAAALASGIVLATSSGRNLTGGLLIGFGALSAGVAALFPFFAGHRGHGLDRDQAQTLVDGYNERLLRDLDLVPR